MDIIILILFVRRPRYREAQFLTHKLPAIKQSWDLDPDPSVFAGDAPRIVQKMAGHEPGP